MARFDIENIKPGGMKEGDTFIGCSECSFIIPPGTYPQDICPDNICPECSKDLNIYKVTSNDVEEVEKWAE